MIIYENQNRCSTLQYYDCFSSLANQQVHKNNLGCWQETSRQTTGLKGWYGVDSIAELRSIVELYGWPVGAIMGQEKLGHIKAPPLPSIRRKRCKAAIGHTLNMQAIYNGNFDKAWSSSTKENSNKTKMAKKGNVNIVIEVSGSCMVDSGDFFWRGAVGVMLARALQKSGRNVRILVAGGSQNYTSAYGPGTDYLQTVVCCKPYGQPLSLDRLFSMTALSGFFRYYMFKAWCSQPNRMREDFGSPKSITEQDLEPLVDKNPVIIVADIWNERDALQTVETLLERFK